MFGLESIICIFNRNFIFDKLKLFKVIIQENIILSQEARLEIYYLKKIFML